MILPPPRSTLFPYTTLFRSLQIRHNALAEYSRLIGMNPMPCILYCEHARIRKVMFDEITILITNIIGSPATDEQRRPLKPRILRSEEHTSELQSRGHLVCRLLLEKKNI